MKYDAQALIYPPSSTFVSSSMLPFRRHILSRVPRVSSRSLASVADTLAPAPYQIFDRYAKVLQKDRSATPSRAENSRTVDYMRDEIGDRLVERMVVSSDPGQPLCVAKRVTYRTSSASSTPCSIWGLAQVTSRNCWRPRQRRRSSCLTRAVRCHHPSSTESSRVHREPLVP